MKEVIEDVPAIALSYKVQVGDGKDVVFQTGIARDCPQKELYDLIDKLQKASDRAILYSKIENAEFEIEKNEALATTLVNNLDLMADKYADRARVANDSGRSRPVIPAGEVAQKENSERSLKMHQDEISKWKAKLASFKAKLVA